MAYKTGYDFARSPRRARPFTANIDSSLARKRTLSPPSIRYSATRDDERRLYRDTAFSATDSNIYGSTRTKTHFLESSTEISLKSQIYELENKIRQKEGQLGDLERELQNYQDIENQQTKTIRQLHDRVESLQRETTEYTNVHSKTELTITTLQTENRQLEDRIADLESRLRRQLEDRDTTSHAVMETHRNYDELKRMIGTYLFTDSFHDTRSHDSLMRKFKEHMDEHNESKSRMLKLEDSLRMSEEESRRSQDTVRKLLDDVEKTRKYLSETDMIKEERDATMRKHDLLQDDLKNMQDRLSKHQRAWDEAQHELRQYQAKLGETDTTLRKQELSSHAQTQEFKAFKETIATLLSDNYLNITSSEEAIKDKIRQLMQSRQDSSKVSRHLEDKLKELSTQLEEQADLHKSAVQRARKAEEEVIHLREKLRSAEGELVATDILKEGMRTDKSKYEKFWDQMVEIMKMNTIVHDLGVELNSDALLARAEQLVRMEEESYSKRNNQVVGAQRHLMDAKRELESRDMQLDLMRRKLMAIETDATARAEHDWEDVVDKNRKLNKSSEKLMRNLHEAKQTIQALKAESIENKSLKITVEEQRKTIRELERRLNELEHQKSKQVRRLNDLKAEKDHVATEATHGLRVTESTIQSISNELQRTKLKLEEVQKKEKQLSDLRHVVARMLGLDVRTLAVPDYEIISRLEKLIESQHEIALEYSKRPMRGGDDLASKRHVLETQRRHKMRSAQSLPRWK